MKAKIRNLDPTGVEVEAEEFELPLVIEENLEAGFEEVIQEDGTVVTYEPTKRNRYFLNIGKFVYSINARTGELILICKVD